MERASIVTIVTDLIINYIIMRMTVLHRIIHTIETKQEVIFDDKAEINLLKDCLNYCYHRGAKHNSPMTGKLNGINQLRRQLGIIK